METRAEFCVTWLLTCSTYSKPCLIIITGTWDLFVINRLTFVCDLQRCALPPLLKQLHETTVTCLLLKSSDHSAPQHCQELCLTLYVSHCFFLFVMSHWLICNVTNLCLQPQPSCLVYSSMTSATPTLLHFATFSVGTLKIKSKYLTPFFIFIFSWGLFVSFLSECQASA